MIQSHQGDSKDLLTRPKLARAKSKVTPASSHSFFFKENKAKIKRGRGDSRGHDQWLSQLLS